jgi:hypothetical protein
MSARRTLLVVRLALAAALWGPAAGGQLRQSYIGVVRQGPELLLEIAAGAAGPADRIELRLTKECVRGASLEFGPTGWKASGEGAILGLEGPGLESFPALFRVRIGEEKTPPVLRIRISAVGEQVAERNVRVLLQPPVTVSRGLEGLLALPAIAFAGENIVARVLVPHATPPSGVWYFDGHSAETLGEAVRLAVPEDANGDAELPARFADPWGRPVVEGVARMHVEPPPSIFDPPRIDGVQPIALAGEALTVCGSFPPDSRAGVVLDGKQSLETVAGSSRSLVLTLPDQTSPGRHLISGDPDAGFPAEVLAFDAVKLETAVDRDVEPPSVRIKVRGSEAPLRIRVVNLNPFAALLEGGESQVVETDGGVENLAYIALRPSDLAGVGPRDLNIVFTLANDRPACPAQGVSLASAPGRRVAH